MDTIMSALFRRRIAFSLYQTEYALQSFKRDEHGYNPAVCIIFEQAGYGHYVNPNNPGDGWYLTKTEAAAMDWPVESGVSIFANVTEVEDINHICQRSTNNVVFDFGEIDLTDFSNFRTIPNGGFENCSELKTVVATNITAIGNESFINCGRLSMVSGCENIVSIGMGAFKGCETLSTGIGQQLPSALTTIDQEAFFGCKNLSISSIPITVNNIGDKAFSGCVGITVSSIPVTVISSGAFYGCVSMTNITLNPKTTSIADLAFGNCINLVSCTCRAKTPPNLSGDPFNKVNQSFAVYVLESAIRLYTGTNWANYNLIPLPR